MFFGTPDGNLFGMTKGPVQIEVSIDGQARSPCSTVDPQMNEVEAAGADADDRPDSRDGRFARDCRRRSSSQSDGPIDDLLQPHRYTLADTQIGTAVRDHHRAPPPRPGGERALRDPSPASPTRPSRGKIFTCRPFPPGRELPCAEDRARPGGRGLPPPPEGRGAEGPHGLLRARAQRDGGFEVGVRAALEAILASPQLLFRPGGAAERDAGRATNRRHGPGVTALVLPVGRAPDDRRPPGAEKDRLHDRQVLTARPGACSTTPASVALATRSPPSGCGCRTWTR